MVSIPDIRLPSQIDAAFDFESGGPYFLPQSTTVLDWDKSFPILTLATSETINKLSTAQIRAKIPSNFLEEAHAKSKIKGTIKTTEEFLASQLLKHVTICCNRPVPNDVPTEFFELKTYFHGILVAASLEFTSHYDVVFLELKPYFWLLTQQNNYRSFEDKNAREIIEEVFNPYKENPALKQKFSFTFDCPQKMAKRIQTIQAGETDFEFVLRLMKEEGLSYFFYHNANSSTLVITDRIASALDKINHDQFKTLTKPLSYFATIADNTQTKKTIIEGFGPMPLYDYKVSLASPLANITALPYPDYRRTDEPLDAQRLEQTSNLFTDSDGFKPEQTVWVPTSQLTEYKKNEKVAHLTLAANCLLERDFSLKFTRSASMLTYGFLPIGRTCVIDLEIEKRRLQPINSSLPNDYVSAVAKKQNFYPYAIEHHFVRPRRVQQMGQPVPPVFLNFQVFVKFFDVGDDTFKPPFEHPQHPMHGHSTHTNNPVYSAVVVDFKKEDKTENNFDVPNAFRIRFPWHKPDQSIKARVSLFWTGNEYGSLFLPEVGSEVLVTFLTDDKDYPVIIGSCYNSKTKYPLDAVKNREVSGEFGARGIVFHAGEAELVYKTVKKGQQETKILTLATTDGNMLVAASNIENTAQKIYKTSVIGPKSSLTMDDKAIFLNGFDNGGTLKIEQNKVSTTAPQVVIDGDSEVKITSGTITANSLKLPK